MDIEWNLLPKFEIFLEYCMILYKIYPTLQPVYGGQAQSFEKTGTYIYRKKFQIFVILMWRTDI